MTPEIEQFTDRVMGNFLAGDLPENRMQSFVASARQIEPGHPAFVELEIGESSTCEMACVFLDLTNFTGRTFWDSAEDVTRLAHAVLSGFTGVVKALGGHVLGLRGDGLFAGFGPIDSAEICVAAAVMASALAIDAVRDGLNPRLDRMGIEPVQARAGADFGTATFVRSGTPAANEVNVIGFASNFAAKCEKIARSWELVVGEGLVSHIANQSVLEQHPDSPKRYYRRGDTRSYKFYHYNTNRVIGHASAAIDELRGRPLERAVG